MTQTVTVTLEHPSRPRRRRPRPRRPKRKTTDIGHGRSAPRSPEGRGAPSHLTSEPVAVNRPDEAGDIQRDRHEEQIGVVTPRFRLVFRTVFGLTVMLLLIDVILVLSLRNPGQEAQSLMDLCSRLVTIGFGAIIGLLGGKVT
jgi:hypothetical protein